MRGRKRIHRLGRLGLVLFFTSCSIQSIKTANVPEEPPAPEKTWTVVVDGRIPVRNLRRKNSGDWSSAEFLTPEGKIIKFFGNFYMFEE